MATLRTVLNAGGQAKGQAGLVPLCSPEGGNQPLSLSVSRRVLLFLWMVVSSLQGPEGMGSYGLLEGGGTLDRIGGFPGDG